MTIEVWYDCLDCGEETVGRVWADNAHCAYCGSMELKELGDEDE